MMYITCRNKNGSQLIMLQNGSFLYCLEKSTKYKYGCVEHTNTKCLFKGNMTCFFLTTYTHKANTNTGLRYAANSEFPFHEN